MRRAFGHHANENRRKSFVLNATHEAKIMKSERPGIIVSRPQRVQSFDSERKGKPEPRDGDWVCPNPNCEDLQFGRNAFCKWCGTKRPKVYGAEKLGRRSKRHHSEKRSDSESPWTRKSIWKGHRRDDDEDDDSESRDRYGNERMRGRA